MGRYHLVDRLAVGGMAEVFLAAERGMHALDRLVVIKRILPHLAEDQSFVEMFLREARIAARIAHPNVVEIYELGESGGYPFIAMEYVPGSTLKQLGRAARESRVQLPPDVVIHLLAQACAGAHAAHELTDSQGQPYGLVHRDLTPHNLMVTDQAHVKLLDFGIAKANSLADQTRTGMLKGKISYMSPEQCRQERLDRRSDIFSLGIVAWELLAGRKPFSGKSELATMQAIVTGNLPHLREVRPDVPEPIAAAIHRALGLEPDQRYDTADSMRRELRTAARLADIHVDEDRAALFIQTLLGEEHDRRRRQVDTALERTLVSLSAVQPSPPTERDSTTEESVAPTRTVATSSMAVALLAVAGTLALAALGAALGVAWALGMLPGEDFGPVVSGEPVVVHVAPTLRPDVLATEHAPIRRYLERELGRPVQLQVADSYDEAVERLVDGDVPYVWVPHRTALHALELAKERKAVVDVLAVKVVDGSTSTDGYLVVPRESTANTPADLKGHVICYPDRLSSTGYHLPRQFLVSQGLNPDVDFVPHFSGNHEQVLRDLMAGVCALGGTFSNNLNSADDRGIPVAQLRVLAITGSTMHDAILAGPAADRTLAKALEAALLSFDPVEDAGVSRVGQSERITGFAPPDGRFYQR